MTQQLGILLLDDERDGVDMLRELLQLYLPHAVCRVAYSGEEALRLFAQEPAQVGIFDLEMPGVGGEEAATTIRKSTPSPLRLIALSGNVFRLDLLRKGAPFDHWLSKPVDIAAVVGLLEDLR